MRLSFVFTAVKGLRKKMKRPKGTRNIRALFKPDSKPSTVEEIPEDVLMKILARLPANSLMMFKCVSKRWSSLISSRYLTNLFLETPSPSRQRRHFMYLVDKGGRGDYALLSTSPENSNSEGNICALNQDLTMPGMGGCFVNALRGLTCFRIERRVQICNLTTKQSVEVPLVRSGILEDDSNMWNYFGYDPIQHEYKVLSTVWKVSNEERVVRSEHQVLVLGPGASWRSTRSTNPPPPPPPPHRPYSQGISINGVLYYGAWNDKNTCVVVSFYLNCEEFNSIELPLEAGIVWHTRATNVVNYGGKVAIFDYSRLGSEGSMDLWVVEDAKKSKWSNKKTFALPKFKFGECGLFEVELLMHGTSRKGEIMLKKASVVKTGAPMHLNFDLEMRKTIVGFLISQSQHSSFDTDSLHMTNWDDFESIMYLEA